MGQKPIFFTGFLLVGWTIIMGIAMTPFGIGVATIQATVFSILMYLTYRLIEFYPKIVLWINTPKSNHLHLYANSFHNKEITLNFIYTEWRYLFRRSEAYISIPSITQPNQGNEFLVWKNNPDQPKIKRLKFYKLGFLTFDVDNKFWVGEDSGNKIGFSPGHVYRFDIFIAVNVFGKSGWKSPNRDFSVIVNYKESHKISIKIVDRKDAYRIFKQEKYPQMVTKE